jgi:ketosteroid isomerase-like protein
VNAASDLNLPAAITRYRAAAEQADTAALLACFTPDALVVDEDRQWRGTEAIRRWRDTVATAYEYTIEVTGARAGGAPAGQGTYEVYTHLTGNFPGGEIDLTDSFVLRDGLIARLEITPTRAAS